MKALKKLLLVLLVAVALCAIVTYAWHTTPENFEAFSPRTHGALFTLSNFFWKPDLIKMLRYKSKVRSFEQVCAAIKAGADVNAVEKFNDYRLNEHILDKAIRAVYIEDHRIPIALIEAGAVGHSPFFYAMSRIRQSDSQGKCDLKNEIHPDVLMALLKAGNDINNEGSAAGCVLMKALECDNSPKIIKILLDAGASVSESDENGMTVLMCAARYYEYPEGIKLLLDAGADPTAKDRDGKTAIDYAKELSFYCASSSAAMHLALTAPRTKTSKNLYSEGIR